MAHKPWSAETIKLREEASAAIDKLARSMHADRTGWGNFDHLDDEGQKDNSLDNKQLTAWLVVTQYQGFDDPELSNIVYCTAGQPSATTKGLASFAFEAYG